MGCIKFIVKSTLFLFNLVYTILGLLIIAAGGYLLYLVHNNDTNKEIDKLMSGARVPVVDDILKYLDYFLIAIIVLGSIIFLISFCGCCGSITENKGMIILYATIMFFLFCASLALVVTKDDVINKILNEVDTRGNKIFNSPDKPLEDKVINAIQMTLKCCGKDGPGFYKSDDMQKKMLSSYPKYFLETIAGSLDIRVRDYPSPSCCSTFDIDAFFKGDKFNETYLENFKCKKEDIYDTGCITKVNEYVEKIGSYYIKVTIGVAVVEMLAMLLAIYMSVQISKKKWTKRTERGYRSH